MSLDRAKIGAMTIADPRHNEFQGDIHGAVGGQLEDEMAQSAFRIGRRDGVETGEMNPEIAVEVVERVRDVGRRPDCPSP